MTGYLIAGAAAAAALGAVLWDRRRTVRIMRRLEEMLTAAMEGNFTEQDFDESRLSALESRLRHYLSASALSARSLQTQRDQISALVSDISHHTRTPVSNLRLYAQLLDEQPLTAEGRDCVRALSAQAEKLQVLIEALVKTSRLETGLLVLHPSPGDLAPLVDRALRQYADRPLHFVLDLKQCRRFGCDIREMAEAMGPENICHLHLSDRTDQCLSALPGRGDFDFRGFFRYLREGGCTADGVIELYRGDFGSEEELQDALDYLKEQTI